MKIIDELLRTKNTKIKTVVVPCALDSHVLESLELVRKEGFIKAILIADEIPLLKLMNELNISSANYEVINESDIDRCLDIAMVMIEEKKADFLMKGLVDTKLILKKVLDKKYHFRTEQRMTHATLVESKYYHKPFLLSDAAMNINTSFETKKNIIQNGVKLLNTLGVKEPKVAILSAVEKVNEQLESTLIASELKQLSGNISVNHAIIDGPLQLDNALNKEAVLHKSIDSLVAGDADFLVMPNLEAGNIFYKSLMFLSDASSASLVLGATFPIIVTSRADSVLTKYNSIRLAVLVS